MGGVRPPPLHPEALAAKLARKVFTNGKSDLEMVAGIYARTLDGAFGGAEKLEFANCGWGDEEVKALAKVLPLARSVTCLISAATPRSGPTGGARLPRRSRRAGRRGSEKSGRASGSDAAWPTSGRRRAEEGVRGAWDWAVLR